MSALRQGQTLSPTRLERVWGKRRPYKEANKTGTETVVVNGKGGFVTLLSVVSFIIKANAEAAERELAYSVERASTKVVTEAGFAVVKANETLAFALFFDSAPQSVIAGQLRGIIALTCPPLEAGDKLTIEVRNGKAGDTLEKIAVEVIELEEGLDHTGAEVTALADHLRRVAEALEHGTTQQDYPTR